MRFLLLMMQKYIYTRFKILNAQIYCKNNDIKLIDQQSEENHQIHFIQFQIVVDDASQRLIRLLYKDRQSNEIILKFLENYFFIDEIKIPFGGMGIWQYIFINSTTQNLNVLWYSNFKLLMNQSLTSHLHRVKLLQENFIRMESLYIFDIHNFVDQCHQQQKITLKFDPQLKILRFGNFNNNLFIISFWVNFIYTSEQLKIIIHQRNGNRIMTTVSDYLMIEMNPNYFFVQKELSQLISSPFKMDGWTFFISEINNYDKSLVYKCYNRLDSIEQTLDLQIVKFLPKLQLEIEKPQWLMLAQVQFNLDHFEDVFCIPGCSVCQDIICLECDKDLILKDGQCTCNKKIYFSFNECFFPDLEAYADDIVISTTDIVLQKCPKYDAQDCQECINKFNSWNNSYCQYEQSGYYLQDHYQYFNYNFIMVVFYKVEQDHYLIDSQLTIKDKQQLYQDIFNNVLLLHNSNHSIYQLGIYANTNQTKVQCQDNYFGKFCKPKIKNCLIQTTTKQCQQCKNNYYYNQQQCKRCPFNCEKCILDPNYKIRCMKCIDNYFLKLNYRCERCQIQYCLICYEYDKYQMSLQEFQFKKNNELKEIGCAECESPYFINVQTRSCQQENFFIEFDFDSLIEECNINNCMYCQKNTCVMCYDNFQIINNACISKFIGDFKGFIQNALYNNFWKYFALITFLYYNYDYSHIIKEQRNIIIMDCDFPQFNKQNDEFICLDRVLQYSDHRRYVGHTFIKFNISVYDNSPQLFNYNSLFDLIDLNDQYYYYFKNMFVLNQIMDLTFDSNNNFSFQDQQLIFGSLSKFRMRINYTFQNDQCIILEHSRILIINNSYIIVENFCLSFLGVDTQIFEIRNTIFEAANQSANLSVIGDNYQFIRFTMENVTFKNFSSDSLIQFRLEATKINISGLNLHNIQSIIHFDFVSQDCKLSDLQIFNDELQKTQFSFVIYSDQQSTLQIKFQSISIINCIFEEQEIFYSESQFYNYDFSFIDLYIYSSTFYQSQFLNIYAQQLQIRNFIVINCQLDSSYNFFLLRTVTDIQLYNLTFINNEIFLNSSLIFIIADKGNCEFDNFSLDGNKFHSKQIEDSIVEVSTSNFSLNNLIIDNCYLESMIFSIQFEFLANISDVDIYSITNQEKISQHQLFYIEGASLLIQLFQLRNCIYQNHLFNIQVLSLSINTTFISNIVMHRDHEQQFIYIKSDEISIEYLTINQLIDLNQIINIGSSIMRFVTEGQVFMSNISISNVQSQFQTLIQIETIFLGIFHFKTDFVNQISTLLDITSQKVGIINASFQQLNLNKLVHFRNSEYVWLLDIIINQKQIKDVFEFSNCNNLLLDNINVYPGLRVQNLFQFKLSHFDSIKISQTILEKLQVENSLIDIDMKGYIKNIQINNSYFNLFVLDKLQSLILNNERFIFTNFIISGLKTNQFSLRGKQMYLLNFAILDSWIDNIKIQILERDYRETLRLNYIWFTVHNSQSLSQLPKQTPIIELLSPNNILIFYNIKIINNRNLYRKFFKIDSKIKQLFSEIIIMNNDCYNYCQDFYGRNNFQNDLISDNNFNGINKQYQKNAIMLKINSKQFRQEFLYFPSGQSLKDYQIFDYIHEYSKNYIYKIEIIEIVNGIEERMVGNFNISAFKYHIQDKVILNQTDNIINFNNFTQTKDYNQLIELKITNNPYQEEICVQLVISFDDPNYESQTFLIKTFICQIGEIFRQDGCLKCDTNYQLYSLRQSSNLCSVFDSQLGTDFKHNSIKLREGFWRPFIYSHVIESCNRKYDRCQGGWKTGNQLCKIGYYGGLCDSCDTNNIIGHGYYQMIDNQCKICDNQLKYGYHLMMKIIILIIIYQAKLYFKSQSNQALYKKYLLQKLIFHQHFQIINIYLIDLSSIILDILIQNISITQQLLRNQEFNLPDYLGIFTNPIQFISNSTFCFSQYFGIEQYQITLIFSFLFPFLIYNIFISISYVIDGIQLRKQYVFIQPIINLFILLGPTLLAQYTANLFYVEYSKQRYVLTDLGIRYFSQQHQEFIKYFILPIIISFGLIIPMILLKQINELTKRLFKKNIFQTYGSLILQYNVKYELIMRYYLTSLLMSLFQINQINVLITPKDLISITLFIFALKSTYKIQKFNKILLKSWTCIGLITYITKIEQQVLDPIILQMIISSLIMIYITHQYIRQLIFAYDQQIYRFIQTRRKLSSYFMFKIQYNEKQYWKLINQLVKLHKIQFVQSKELHEKIILQTVLKISGQNYQNFLHQKLNRMKEQKCSHYEKLFISIQKYIHILLYLFIYCFICQILLLKINTNGKNL